MLKGFHCRSLGKIRKHSKVAATNRGGQLSRRAGASCEKGKQNTPEILKRETRKTFFEISKPILKAT